MNNEIRALDLISTLLNSNRVYSDYLKISFADVNKFRDNLFLEEIAFDLGLYDFEEISYSFPKNIQITSNEIIVRIDEDFENRILKTISNDICFTKILELWEK